MISDLTGRFVDETAARRVLITCNGTVVCFDVAAGRLRHERIGAGPANVFVTVRGVDVRVWWRDDYAVWPLGDFGPDACEVAAGRSGVGLTARLVGPEVYALQVDGRCLDAGPDGAIRMSEVRDRDRQSFLLIDPDDLERLEFVLANRWLSPVSGQPASMPVCVAPHLLAIGDIRLSLQDVVLAVKSGAELPHDLFLPFDGWKLAHFTLFRPLAYLVAYGNAEMFRCADIAIRSLFAFGEWDGDVLIITDDESIPFLDTLPREIRVRVKVALIPAHDVLDYTLARYRIAELGVAEMYQPVLYLDTDVVCDAPLSGLLQAMVFATELQAYAEKKLGHERDFYGKSLLEADGIVISPDDQGFSSGVFAFRNIAQQRRLFRMIIDVAYRFTSLAGRRDLHDCYDQVFFNYVLHKTKLVSGDMLKDVVTVHLNHLPLLGEAARKGFVHFAGGVGNTTPKLTHMMRYCQLLGCG